MNKENKMRHIKIEKVVLNVGATGAEIEKGVKLLKLLTGKNPAKRKARKRIPALGVRPGLEVGAVVTLRKNFEGILKKMLAAVDNKIKRKQVADNHFSFGIHEYIEIPGTEFQRDIGIRGLDVTVVFERAGKRVAKRKIKRGKIPKRQAVTKKEIINFMENKFEIRFEGKET